MTSTKTCPIDGLFDQSYKLSYILKVYQNMKKSQNQLKEIVRYLNQFIHGIKRIFFILSC